MTTLTNHTRENAIDPAMARKRLQSAAVLHWSHWVIIGFSLVLTFFAWYYSKSALDERVRLQFDREADHVVELVKERMQKYEVALRSGVAFIDASGGDVDFDHWKLYADSINIQSKYPGINGIGVIHALSKDDVPTYLAEQRGDRPDFKIHPPHNGDEHYPISYIIPVESNYKAVGLDMAHESNRYTAAKNARDTGQSQITGPITLVQGSAKTPGFLFYSPFYKVGDVSSNERKANFSGMVYAPFFVKKLMDGTLEEEKRHVGIRLTDGEEVLYDEHVAAVDDFDPHPLFTRTTEVELYGRTWTFDIRSAQSFRAAATDSQPMTILVGGIVIDSLLLVLFISISRSSRRALSYAHAMTHALEVNAQALKAKATELERSNENLSRFNKTTTGREKRMIELKQEVNNLLMAAGKTPRYDVNFADEGSQPTMGSPT